MAEGINSKDELFIDGKSTKRFIAMVKRDNFDYTVWRRGIFDGMSLDEINREAAAYVEKHPHNG